MSTGALQRAVGRAATRRDGAVERCGMCSTAVPDQHRHLFDEQAGTLLCACTPCGLLFEREAAGGDRYRLVPNRRIRLTGVSAEALNVPVGLAFFVSDRNGRVQAHYPSPLGTTESEVDPAVWRTVVAQSPSLAEMIPQVEALLVRTNARSDRDEHWILPLDDCFRLVAVIRQNWTGMSGGSAVWREVARFFDELGRRPGYYAGRQR